LLKPLNVVDRSEVSAEYAWKMVANIVLELSERDHMTLLCPHDSRGYMHQYDSNERPGLVRSLFDPLRIREPVDAVVLLGLRDLLDVSDIRVLSELYDPVERSIDVDANALPDSDLDNRLSLLRSSILQIALWVAMKQRGLPTLEYPAALQVDEVERLEAVVPKFVAQTRQLAAESGVPDLLP
jgi:hypothetical protein